MNSSTGSINRRDFMKRVAGGVAVTLPLAAGYELEAAPAWTNPIFWITGIPEQPFGRGKRRNNHAGVDTLLRAMGANGLKFYRSSRETGISGPSGLIDTNDVVLIKVNAQWKHRGCTNSDLIRGLIQRVISHPDGFEGEVVIVENGQGRGSLKCDTSSSYDGDHSVQANANNKAHSFVHLVDRVFVDPRVSYYLLDPIRETFIEAGDHVTEGYRIRDVISYPCFTTKGGHRVDLAKGIWREDRFVPNLKLINVPVLKHHDEGGSEITASLKHFYGLVSMKDGHSDYRHYEGLGVTCGKMVVSVRAPVLNIVDAIWVSHRSLAGYPADKTFRANQLMASQDPVALDYCAAKYIIYPIDNNARHHPTFEGIARWLSDARAFINRRGGIRNDRDGIQVSRVTMNEDRMALVKKECSLVT
jgi:uncharacterized protein (DUF362 family)